MTGGVKAPADAEMDRLLKIGLCGLVLMVGSALFGEAARFPEWMRVANLFIGAGVSVTVSVTVIVRAVRARRG